MKIVFFGSSNVALPVLEALHKTHQILAVVSQPDAVSGRNQNLLQSPVALLAGELSLPLLKPESVKNNPDFFEQIKRLNADIFIVVSYGKILPKALIELPALKTLNVHFSALPKYRGAAPIQHALLNGDTHTATTIFLLDEFLDHGPILAQTKVNIEPDDNFITLSQRLAKISAELLLQILPKYQAGGIIPQEQNHAQASSTRIVNRLDGKIDWKKPARQIYNQFRAFYPWPGIWTNWQGQVLKILDCKPGQEAGDFAPGEVFENGKIVCGNRSILEIFQLQLAGKKPTDIQSFLNGYGKFVGSKLSD